MENDDIVANLCIIIIANAVKIIRKRQSRRRQSTRPWIQRQGQHRVHLASLEAFLIIFTSFVFVSSTPYTPHVFLKIYSIGVDLIKNFKIKWGAPMINTCLLKRFNYFYFNLLTLILSG